MIVLPEPLSEPQSIAQSCVNFLKICFDPNYKNNIGVRDQGCGFAVELLPDMHKLLSPIPSTAEKHNIAQNKQNTIKNNIGYRGPWNEKSEIKSICIISGKQCFVSHAVSSGKN